MEDNRQTTPLALVTGATGFIGQRLVGRLLEAGYRIRALVRNSSDTRWLRQRGCELSVGDVVYDPASVATALRGVDLVFHVAAETHAVRSSELVERNLAGTRNVLEQMAAETGTRRLILVSSLAVTGPTTPDRPVVETSPYNPVSYYGESKVASEQAAYRFAEQLDISIVRPPIVLGEGDLNGLEMFKPIDSMNVHFVPGFYRKVYSLIHVEDLAESMLVIAQRGQHIKQLGDGQGVYFAACDEADSFTELGRRIGRLMGRRRTFVIKVAKPVMWLVCLWNEGKSRMTGRREILDLDKFRDGFAGSWYCSNEKIKRELGVRFEVSLDDRLQQTICWYRKQGWLKADPQGEQRSSSASDQSSSKTESFG